MPTKLATILASLTLASTAFADRPVAPKGPDFVDSAPSAAPADRDLAVSTADRPLRPVAVVPFGFDSTAIFAADVNELVTTRNWLGTHPNSYVVIEGYTDETGSRAYNAGLARRRAEAVRDRLIVLGARPEQLVIGVFGEAKATSPNPVANRRVILRGTADSLATITSRAKVDGLAVTWIYAPTAVARR